MSLSDKIFNAVKGQPPPTPFQDRTGVHPPPPDTVQNVVDNQPKQTQFKGNTGVIPGASAANAKNPEEVVPDLSNRANFLRNPFTMDCVSWRKSQKKIVFRCNPNKIGYEWPIRGATQNVKSGKVFYWWRNKAKQSHFDLPIITFGFQSGNIAILSRKGAEIPEDLKSIPPKGGFASELDVYMPEGLDNFYHFMSLVDETKILTPSGNPNFVTITHHSEVFPSLILTGFFDPSTPITVSESTEDTAHITWEAKFLVHYSEPRFNSASFAKTFSQYFTNQRNLLKGTNNDANNKSTGF
jgi:hypothetical protein